MPGLQPIDLDLAFIVNFSYYFIVNFKFSYFGLITIAIAIAKLRLMGSLLRFEGFIAADSYLGLIVEFAFGSERGGTLQALVDSKILVTVEVIVVGSLVIGVALPRCAS